MALHVCEHLFHSPFNERLKKKRSFDPKSAVAESFCTPTLQGQSVRPGIRSLALMEAGQPMVRDLGRRFE
jgi:hypothetical protein